MKFIRKVTKKEKQALNSKDAAKERLHLVLMQDRANVSADFLELMKQEIIEVIKKYIEVDETSIDVRMTNKDNGDGTKGAPALYANIPIINIKDERKQNSKTEKQESSINEEEKNNKDEKETKEKGKNKAKKESKVVRKSEEEAQKAEEQVHEEKEESKEEVTQNIEK